MNHETKRRRLETLVSTITSATEQLQSLFDTQEELHSIDQKVIQEIIQPLLQTNADFASNLYSRLKGDTKQLKRYASEIALHERSTVEIRPDGSIVTMAHPLPYLPNEIIISILDHIPEQLRRPTFYQFTLTTRHFNSIVTPLLWNDIHLDKRIICERFFRSIYNVSSERLSTLALYIHHLRIPGCSSLHRSMYDLLPRMSNLKHMTLTTNKMTNSEFERVIELCTSITSLNLYFTHLFESPFSTIGEWCSQLTELEWGLGRRQSLEWLEHLVQCPLKSLSLTLHYGTISDKARKTIQHFDQLTYLKIKQNGATHTNHLITTTTLHSWTQLTTLDLYIRGDMDESTLNDFVKLHPHLENLHLDCSMDFSNAFLGKISMWLPNLTALFLTPEGTLAISYNVIRQLITKCPHLIMFELTYYDPDLREKFSGFYDVDTRENVLKLNHSAIYRIKQQQQQQQ